MEGEEPEGSPHFYDEVHKPFHYGDDPEQQGFTSRAPSSASSEWDCEDEQESASPYNYEDELGDIFGAHVVETWYYPAPESDPEDVVPPAPEKELPPIPPAFTSTLKRDEPEIRQKKSDLEHKPRSSSLNTSKSKKSKVRICSIC